MSPDERSTAGRRQDATPDTDPAPDPETRVASDPSDAFGALGNEHRMGILESLLERADDETRPSRMRFSDLFEASDVETTAGFAYHLERLVGPYLRKVEDEGGDDREGAGYELTYAGAKIARAITAGAYTHRVDHPPLSLADPCPICGEPTLEARIEDNVVTVCCPACDAAVLRMGFPPSGLEAHGDDFPAAFDRYHRHRLALARDGVCPECGGEATATLALESAGDADEETDPETRRAQARFDCRQCGHELRSPVSLTLLEHPAVVSIYHEHGLDVRDRPIWNVGREWTEAVISSDPPAVRVVVTLEGDVLALYVDGTLEVVDVQRSTDREDADERS